MKKDYKISPSCEQAVERVRHLVSSGKFSTLDHLFAEEHKALQFYTQAHQCMLVKFPRVPLNFEKIPYHAIKKGRKPKMVSLEPKSDLTPSALQTHQCGTNQMEEIYPKPSGLNPERFMRWKLKEYLLAARRLKGLRKEQELSRTNVPKKHDIVAIGQKDAQREEDIKNAEYWQEMIRSKEERHFQLTRIIKYFSN